MSAKEQAWKTAKSLTTACQQLKKIVGPHPLAVEPRAMRTSFSKPGGLPTTCKMHHFYSSTAECRSLQKSAAAPSQLTTFETRFIAIGGLARTNAAGRLVALR